MNEIVVSRKCNTCSHMTGEHRLDSLGRTRCPECPQEMCGGQREITQEIVPMSQFADATTIGLAPINEMRVDQLVEEIMHEQWNALHKFDVDRLRAMVAQIRVGHTRERIYREAGVTEDPYGFNRWLRGEW